MEDGMPTPTCQIVRTDATYNGKQGLTYFAGISAESVGAQGLCMHMLRMPPVVLRPDLEDVVRA
jgi:uncharacterized RmlC-like cupin family protein